jgi:Tol biopolymer transport system component
MKSTSPLLLSGLAAVLISPLAFAQDFTAISKSTAGVVGDKESGEPRISEDGRYVAFASKAANLVAGDANGFFDIYLRDTVLGTTIRVSNGLAGAEPNDDSRWPEISEDGAYVLYSSAASNIVAGDTNAAPDLFLYTVATGTVERVNLTYLGLEAAAGVQMDHDLYDLSDDGRYIVFTSSSDDYVTIMTSNATRNVFLRDRIAGTTSLVSYKIGDTGSAGGYAPSISADGSKVVFVSGFWLLHPDDPDSNDDIFLYTTSTGVVSLVSYNTAGTSGSSPGHSTYPIITPDGRYVVFESTSDDLAIEDTNLDSDIFLRDLTTGVTEVISFNSDGGVELYSSAKSADVSADARYVAFTGHAKTEAPTPLLGRNVYVRDRTLGTTVLVNHPRWWFPFFMAKASDPQITNDGDGVVMIDGIGTAEEGDSIYGQVNHITHESGVGSMSMIGYDSVAAGSTFPLTLYDGPPSSTVYILYSSSITGFTYAGHSFDIGAPVSVLATTTTDATGYVYWTSPTVPPSASGRAIHVEMASTSGGVWYDSNHIPLTIL